MKKIQLENGRTIELHYGENINKAPALLERQDSGEGFILSELDIRKDGVKYFKKHPQIIKNYYDSATLSATKGKTVKVILPYETGSRTLTSISKMAWGWVNPNEELVNYGVNLDVDRRWEKLKGSGVYTFQRKGLILDRDLTEAEAMKHKLLLTKLGHPDHVEKEFWMYKGEKNKSIQGVQGLIHNIFKLGKSEHGYDTMMGQYMPDVSDKGVLKEWCVYWLAGGAGSGARSRLGNGVGRFAFDSVGDAKTDAKDVDVDKARTQLQTLEGMLKPEQINQLGGALNERDQLRERLSGLTTDQIYSAIGNPISSASESEVRKVLDGLTSQ